MVMGVLRRNYLALCFFALKLVKGANTYNGLSTFVSFFSNTVYELI